MTTKNTTAPNAAPLSADDDDETLARAFVIWLAAFALALLFSVFVISDAQSATLHIAERAASPLQHPAQAMPTGLIAATEAALAPTAAALDAAAPASAVKSAPTRDASNPTRNNHGRTALGFRPLQKGDFALGGIFAAMMVAGYRLGNRRP